MKQNDRIVLDSIQFDLTIKRLAQQLIENHDNFENTIIIGIQPRGVFLASRIKSELKKINEGFDIRTGVLDVTFYRDDYRRQDIPLVPSETDISFLVENKKVILVDDVLFTGRTIRSGLDAILAFGRPKKVELLVLINRRYERHLPIQADYIGKNVHSVSTERVIVSWKETEEEDKVILYTPDNE